ncbi:hypothetical protein [Burkholderia gladioli]|uniref:hypothetical protein n=1 Tax=Burkholderia gladioli TaxID=28095 RepID=UPI002FE40D64
MTTPLNTTVISSTGLRIGRVAVTSLDVCRGSDGVTSISMTDGDMTLRIFADVDQVKHLVALLSTAEAKEGA